MLRKTTVLLLALALIVSSFGLLPLLAQGINEVTLGEAVLDGQSPECTDGAGGKAVLEGGVLTLEGFNNPAAVLSIGGQQQLTIVLKGDNLLGGISISERADIIIKGDVAAADGVKLPSLTIDTTAISARNESSGSEDASIAEDSGISNSDSQDISGESAESPEGSDAQEQPETTPENQTPDESSGEYTDNAAIYINGSLMLQSAAIAMETDTKRGSGVVCRGDIQLQDGASLSASSGQAAASNGIMAEDDIQLQEGCSIAGTGTDMGIVCKSIVVPEDAIAEGTGSTGIYTHNGASISGAVKATGAAFEAGNSALYYGVYSGRDIDISLGSKGSIIAQSKLVLQDGLTGGAMVAKGKISIDENTQFTDPPEGMVSKLGEAEDAPSAITDKEGNVAENVNLTCKTADKGLLLAATESVSSVDRTQFGEEQLNKLDQAYKSAKALLDDEKLTARDQQLIDQAKDELLAVLSDMEQQAADSIDNTTTDGESTTVTPTIIPTETTQATVDSQTQTTGTAAIKPYYANISQWISQDGKYRALDDDGDDILKNWGWDKLRSTWYYFDENGYMVTNTWVQTKNIRGILRWYYLTGSGAMATGWQKLDGKWYYLHDESGHILTGWQKINDTWYCMDGDGVMLTRWVTYKGESYYMGSSGAMYTGYWQAVDNTTSRVSWQYFDKDGVWHGEVTAGWAYTTDTFLWRFLRDWKAVTGWQQINGVWYYFSNAGIMRTGWVYTGKWYYMRSSGAMLTGWLKYKDKWYWLGNSGAMVADAVISIGGQKHSFASDGVWLRKSD